MLTFFEIVEKMTFGTNFVVPKYKGFSFRPYGFLVLANKSVLFDDISWIWCFWYQLYKVLSS